MFLRQAIFSFLLIFFADKSYGQTINWCAQAIDRVEKAEGMPRFLMHAISVVESGRLDPESNTVLAHPWTINVNGKGEYFATKQEAINRTKVLVKKGIKNIDIGCMQINLGYHPKAFANIETAFDPYHNALYAAKFLKKLMEERKSWSMAIGHYHSSVQPHYISYRKRVYDQWSKEKLKDSGINLNKESLALSKSMFPYKWLFQLRPPSPPKVSVPSVTAKASTHFLFPLTPPQQKG